MWIRTLKKCSKKEWLSYEIHRQCYENTAKRTRKAENNLPYISIFDVVDLTVKKNIQTRKHTNHDILPI